MAAARDGDAGDDGEIFAAIYPGLRRFAGAIRPPDIDADDLIQEALARTLAVRSLASIEHPTAYLRTAMVRVASNLARGRRRSAARERRDATADHVADVYPSDLDDLMRVAPVARAVLFLTVVEGRTYREAAEIVGGSEAAARQHASRALRTLRAEIGTDRAREPKEAT